MPTLFCDWLIKLPQTWDSYPTSKDSKKGCVVFIIIRSPKNTRFDILIWRFINNSYSKQFLSRRPVRRLGKQASKRTHTLSHTRTRKVLLL
jgi:hypothetical protein